MEEKRRNEIAAALDELNQSITDRGGTIQVKGEDIELWNDPLDILIYQGNARCVIEELDDRLSKYSNGVKVADCWRAVRSHDGKAEAEYYKTLLEALKECPSVSAVIRAWWRIYAVDLIAAEELVTAINMVMDSGVGDKPIDLDLPEEPSDEKSGS